MLARHRRPAAGSRVLDTHGPYSRNGGRDSTGGKKKIRNFRTIVCKNARRGEISCGILSREERPRRGEISPEIYSKYLFESNNAACRRYFSKKMNKKLMCVRRNKKEKMIS